MPRTFDKLGISFQYPDNWTLDDSDALLGRQSVTVTSPSGAFWSVTLHSGSTNPGKLAAAAVAAMQKEYGGVEAEEAEEILAGQPLAGYDLAFYCFDLTNTAMVRTFSLAGATYTVFWQAEDRDYQQLAMVFQAITASLITELKKDRKNCPKPPNAQDP